MHDLPAGRDASQLFIVPGTRVVLFLVQLDRALSVLSARPAAFLDSLQTAVDLLSFGGLHREEERLEELLPWAGAV